MDVPSDRERRSRRSARTTTTASSSSSSTQGGSSDTKSPQSPATRKVPENINIVGARSANSSIRKRRKNEAKTPTGSGSSDVLRRTAFQNMAQTHQENFLHHAGGGIPFPYSDPFLGGTSGHESKTPHFLTQHEPGVPHFTPSPFHGLINGGSLHAALSAQNQNQSNSSSGDSSNSAHAHAHLPTPDSSGDSHLLTEFTYPMSMPHSGHQEFNNNNNSSSSIESIFYTGDDSLSSSMSSTHGHPVMYNSHSLPASVSANSLYHRAYGGGTGDIDHRISCSYDSGIANTSNASSPMYSDGTSMSYMNEIRRLRHMVDEQQRELNNRCMIMNNTVRRK